MHHNELAGLCSRHLDEEEKLLAVALIGVRAVQGAFARKDSDAIAAAVRGQHDFGAVVGELHTRRRALRRALAPILGVNEADVRLARVLSRLPDEVKQSLQARLTRVRGQASEIVAMNHWLAVHVRVHLDAYQRLMRDLTGAADCGRYGPGGRAETPEYRPLIEIHG